MKTFLFTLLCFAICCTSFTACETEGDDEENNDVFSNSQEYDGHTYAITVDKYTWTEAKQLAEENGGHLVVINNQEENDFILNTYRAPLNIEGDILWIGLSDEAQEGNFVWVNDEPVNYTNWADGEPNNDNNTQNYVHMYSNGTWDDVENIDCFAVFEFDN